VAVVIPAHNEHCVIGRCVGSVRQAAELVDRCEIVVIADNCTDLTASYAERAGARVLVRNDAAHQGKGYALKFAFSKLLAEGIEAIIVVDADSIATPNFVREIERQLRNGAAAVQCRYRVANTQASMRTRLMDIALLAFNVVRPKGRDGWGVSAGISGNGFGLRRETIESVPYDAASIVEDLEYHLLLVAANKKVQFVDSATVYGEMPASRHVASTQRSRWEGGRLRMAVEWTPKLIRQIANGKLRFVEPLLDLLSLPLAIEVFFLAILGIQPIAAFRWCAAVGMAAVTFHVVTAAFLGGRPLSSLLWLSQAPFYILWKLSMIPATWRLSRRNARWVRTQRGEGMS
jgi:cellulose synthase/poly-beta-1,6-N-acetylglucosamine synthase-like glycosyltransferase